MLLCGRARIVALIGVWKWSWQVEFKFQPRLNLSFAKKKLTPSPPSQRLSAAHTGLFSLFGNQFRRMRSPNPKMPELVTLLRKKNMISLQKHLLWWRWDYMFIRSDVRKASILTCFGVFIRIWISFEKKISISW